MTYIFGDIVHPFFRSTSWPVGPTIFVWDRMAEVCQSKSLQCVNNITKYDTESSNHRSV